MRFCWPNDLSISPPKSLGTWGASRNPCRHMTEKQRHFYVKTTLRCHFDVMIMLLSSHVSVRTVYDLSLTVIKSSVIVMTYTARGHVGRPDGPSIEQCQYDNEDKDGRTDARKTHPQTDLGEFPGLGFVVLSHATSTHWNHTTTYCYRLSIYRGHV